MPAKWVVLGVFLLYFFGYRIYARYLAKRIYELREEVETPAHRYKDDIDYVPTRWYILWGHHYASIAGLGPILGPAVAVIYGWVPALFWVVLGAIFIGAVHDFSALVLSIRAKGYSIGSITEFLIGKWGRFFFLLLIFFLVSLAMGVFVIVLGFLFSPQGFPQVFTPSLGILVLAVFMGFLSYKKGIPLSKMGIPIFLLLMGLVGVGTIYKPSWGLEASTWQWIMLIYAFFASILPVWLLLQSRDFLNAFLLILGVFLLYLGFFFTPGIHFIAPPLRVSPEGAPSLFPFVFILIACGAISGFHSLVASGTTAKQLDKETHALRIGYGGMIGESLLGLIAVLATTVAFSSQEEWLSHYANWHAIGGLGSKVRLFIEGGASFLSSLLPAGGEELAASFIAFIVVSFALTTLDSATRLLRYNIEELAEFIPQKGIRNIFQNRVFSSFLAVLAIGFFAFYKIDGKPAGKVLWQLFGTTNQLLGALALLVATIYLFSRGKNPLYTLIPLVFMLIATGYALIKKVLDFLNTPGTLPLLFVSFFLLFTVAFLGVESIRAIFRYRKQKEKLPLDILS